MHPRSLLFPLACACGVAGAAEHGAPAKEPPRLAWRSAIDGLPAAADPAAIDWRASNQTVYRLNGHIGHWRGALQLPPMDSAKPALPARAAEPRR